MQNAPKNTTEPDPQDKASEENQVNTENLVDLFAYPNSATKKDEKNKTNDPFGKSEPEKATNNSVKPDKKTDHKDDSTINEDTEKTKTLREKLTTEQLNPETVSEQPAINDEIPTPQGALPNSPTPVQETPPQVMPAQEETKATVEDNAFSLPSWKKTATTTGNNLVTADVAPVTTSETPTTPQSNTNTTNSATANEKTITSPDLPTNSSPEIQNQAVPTNNLDVAPQITSEKTFPIAKEIVTKEIQPTTDTITKETQPATIEIESPSIQTTTTPLVSTTPSLATMQPTTSKEKKGSRAISFMLTILLAILVFLSVGYIAYTNGDKINELLINLF